MARRTLLVDADIVAYKFAAATESVYYFNGRDAEPAVDEGDLSEALILTEQYIEEMADLVGATDVIVCLTDASNFRHLVWPEYKANRAGLRKPSHLTQIKDHFKTTYRTYQRPGLEADDCMGILATHPSLVSGEKVILSEDKDMEQIPGLLFNPRKDKKPRRIERLQADLFHLAQTVIGDRSDGYPGAPGIGPKAPEVAALWASQTVKEAWGHVLEAYARSYSKRGLNPESPQVGQDAIVQARLARILRATDWDFQAKRPRLWVPPKLS